MKWRGLYPQNSHKVGDNNACISSQHETRGATTAFIRNTFTSTDSVTLVFTNTSTTAVFNRNTIATSANAIATLSINAHSPALSPLQPSVCRHLPHQGDNAGTPLLLRYCFWGGASGTTSIRLLHLYFKLLLLGVLLLLCYFYFHATTSCSTLLHLLLW